jgi:DNA-binding beta-propeller fold protein YncE
LRWARWTSIGTVALAIGAAGCGEPPPAAEPADAPAPARAPAGTVFRVGSMPEGLVFDSASGLLFAGLRVPGRLAVIDPAGGRKLRVLSLPAPPRHLNTSGGGEVLVPAEEADSLVLVSPEGRIDATVPVGKHPHDAAAAAGRVFVSNEFGDTVSVVQGDRVVRTLDAPLQPGGIAAVAGRYVALVAVRARVLASYDARTLTELGETDAGEGPTHAISLGDTVLVADTEGDALLRFRPAPEPELVGRTEMAGAPYGLAFDRRRRLLWVTQTARNTVEVLRVGRDRLTRVAGFPTVRQPNSVAVDPRTGTGFVAGRAGGEVQRIPLGAAGEGR